jgi:hypothetical protein
MAAQYKWSVRQLDVKTAFLNGIINREIYLEPPILDGGDEDGKHENVWLLKKSLYGLKQSPRLWNEKLNQVAEKLNLKQATQDKCVYYQHSNNKLCLVMAVYVDDILITGEEASINSLVLGLHNELSITDLGNVSEILGIKVLKDEFGNYQLTQADYALKLVERAGLKGSRTSELPMDSNSKPPQANDELPNLDRGQFQELLGGLLYLSTSTRPDLSTSVGLLARHASRPQQPHYNALWRIFKFLKKTYNMGLVFKQENSLLITSYTDSDWAGDAGDRRSTTGTLICIGQTAIIWRSVKQTALAKSSVEAELLASSSTLGEVLWLRLLLAQLLNQEPQIVPMFCDNTGAINIAKNGTTSRKTRHIEIRELAIHEAISTNKIEISYIKTTENPADLFTKPLSKAKFEEYCNQINLLPICFNGDVLRTTVHLNNNTDYGNEDAND